MNKIAAECCGSCECIDGDDACDQRDCLEDWCDNYTSRNPIENPLKADLDLAIETIKIQDKAIDKLLKKEKMWEELKKIINHDEDPETACEFITKMNQLEKNNK